MSVLSKAIVNTGARLYKKKYKRAAVKLWALPGVISKASPVNVKKYLSLSSDKVFSQYVKEHYFSICRDEELLAWIYSEAAERNLSALVEVIERGFTYSSSFVFISFEQCLKSKNYTQLSVLIKSFDRGYILSKEIKTPYNSLLVGLLYSDDTLLGGLSVNKESMRLLKAVIPFYRACNIDIPVSVSKFIKSNQDSIDKGALYSYCQAVQSLGSLSESVDQWQAFICLYPDHVRARQNLLLQLCKIDDKTLLEQFQWLADSESIDERLVNNVYKSANRINSIDFLSELNSVKKKNQYSLRVSLEIHRKNDFMDEVEILEKEYVSQYGVDKWYSTFKAKKLIDFGLYTEATAAFKAIKGQKLYYAVSLLKDKKIDKAFKVFNSFKPNHKDYLSAQRYIADISFYESENWKLSACAYFKVLESKFDYQVNLRYLKSCILMGRDIAELDLSSVTREDQFYLKFIWSKKNQKDEASLKYLNQIYSDAGLRPLIYRKTDNYFDSIGSKSKPVNSEKLVSVIMTAYKAKDYIDRAINSILNQSHQNLELIVVEDNSPDNTFDYIKERFGSKVTLLKTEKNSGTYVAKNIGIKNAKGEYITFMDSDDWSHPDRIAKQVNLLEANKAVQACQTGHLRMTEDGDLLFRKRGVNLDVPISLMIRKSVVGKIGYFDFVRASGDSEYIGRLKAVYGSDSISYLKAPMILARQAEGSLTTAGATALTWAGMPKVRIDYRREFRRWHLQAGDLYMSNNFKNMAFKRPKSLQSRAV